MSTTDDDSTPATSAGTLIQVEVYEIHEVVPVSTPSSPKAPRLDVTTCAVLSCPAEMVPQRGDFLRIYESGIEEVFRVVARDLLWQRKPDDDEANVPRNRADFTRLEVYVRRAFNDRLD